MIKLVITDLDDTLYSWIGFFVPAFYNMVQELSKILDISEEELLIEYKAVHQNAGSVEYPYATLNLPAIKKKFPEYSKEQIQEVLNPAFHSFNSVRKDKLQLYPNVNGFLEFLTLHNIAVVGYTESAEENGFYRLQKLNIDQYFKKLYVSDSQYVRPNNIPSSSKTQIVHGKKPNPDLLQQICDNENISLNEAIYIGDSLTKDIFMAKQAGILSVWLNYAIDNGDLYKKLVAISHWSEEDFIREKQIKEQWINSGLSPDFTIKSFSEVIEIISKINNY